jgi:aminopeptidase N
LPAEEPSVAPGTGLEILAETFATYVERFGPYPFVEFDLVEAVVPIDGYEFPGMAYIDYAKRTQETRQDYRYTVAHEVAHQWWYGLVGNHPVHEPWLDEALASYSVLIVLEDTQGSKAGAALVDHWRRTDGPRGPEDPPVDSPASVFSTWGPYHATVYTRGALFLDELRGALGDEGFLALLKRYQQTYRYQIGSTGDFLDLAEEIAGRDLDALFTTWFEIEAVQASRGGKGVSASSSPGTHPSSANSRLPSRKGGPPE